MDLALLSTTLALRRLREAVDPPRSRTRRTPFKLIERFPDQLQGQFRFNREDGYIYRPLSLVSGGDTTGAWRKVHCSVEYPRLVFKLMPSTEDMYLLRLRRSVPLGKYLTIRHKSFKNFTVGLGVSVRTRET